MNSLKSFKITHILLSILCVVAVDSAQAKKDEKEKDSKKEAQEELAEKPKVPSWDKLNLRADLYEIREEELAKDKDMEKRNLKVLQELVDFAPESRARIEGVTQAQAYEVMRTMMIHPVTSGMNKPKYDPKGSLGFCFGRALFAHLELIRRGVDKNSIKKVFIVGPMKAGGIDWQFHVATVVRASDKNTWYAIDQGSVYEVKDWFNHFNAYSVDKKLRLFVTNPAKIGPSAWEYNVLPGGLNDAVYNDYFKDIFKSFKQTRLTDSQKFGKRCSQAFL